MGAHDIQPANNIVLSTLCHPRRFFRTRMKQFANSGGTVDVIENHVQKIVEQFEIHNIFDWSICLHWLAFEAYQKVVAKGDIYIILTAVVPWFRKDFSPLRLGLLFVSSLLNICSPSPSVPM